VSARYEQLRESVAALAAAAEVQIAYLDQLFAECTGGGDASGYGNIELVEQIGDSELTLDDMVRCGELTRSEAEAVRELDGLIERICSQADDALWERAALFSDVRWENLRDRAAEVLIQLPEKPCS
jgi:hypothetical protein